MKKHIECGELVDLLVEDYDDCHNGLFDAYALPQDISRNIRVKKAKYIVEDVPFYFARDLLDVEAEQLEDELIEIGATVRII